MARSTYIYVVSYSGGLLVAAFTVKHELVSWLRRNTTAARSKCQVLRLRDGGGGVPVILDMDELMGEPEGGTAS